MISREKDADDSKDERSSEASVIKKPKLPLQPRVVWSRWKRYPWFSKILIDWFTLFLWPARQPKCYNVYPWWSSHYCFTTSPCKWWCFWKRRFFIISVTSCFLSAHLALLDWRTRQSPCSWWFKSKSENSLFTFYCSLITVHWLLLTSTVHYAFLCLFKGSYFGFSPVRYFLGSVCSILLRLRIAVS